ncbi:hypothetical protein ElyMa_000887000 [Elysia marginata]|uniref:Uncharacterized protein n=1 Tax=Elysia marginata TaxID=1093978 RepID=A0AAV4H6V8_9GAST|nr:hypothetical protein ElyMa_000887000 [Elysia marginata]
MNSSPCESCAKNAETEGLFGGKSWQASLLSRKDVVTDSLAALRVFGKGGKLKPILSVSSEGDLIYRDIQTDTRLQLAGDLAGVISFNRCSSASSEGGSNGLPEPMKR